LGLGFRQGLAVSNRFNARLNALSSMDAGAPIRGGRCGIEKESLRVTSEGFVAATPHPTTLGSALTNRYVTTDYSEALLEFVTPPMGSSWEAIQFLCDIHQFAYEEIRDEYLWAVSMPCRLRSESDIPLARYGRSNIGAMKTAYRRGLGYRYGRYMQAISGIHFNYSLPEPFWQVFQQIERSTDELVAFRSDAYLGLVRNVRRFDWLLLYLFGASPAVCKSFLGGAETDLDELDEGTVYGPFSTSLRMSGIGYQNANQAALNVSANSLEEYIRDLRKAVRTPNVEYQKIGVKVGSEYRQLSANQLQIENEYYSTIRPKRVAADGEHPTDALSRGGVEYVELRALDVSPFDPIGINRQQVKFLEVFLIYCLLKESPPIDQSEHISNTFNHASVAERGRQPGLALRRSDEPVQLKDWAKEMCDEMRGICEMLDPDGHRGYTEIVEAQSAAIDDPELTPSARLIADLRQTGLSMSAYGLELSRGYAGYFKDLAPDMNSHGELLREESRQSLERQSAIEAAENINFDDYLNRYFE
jgi:glutamate--cysteine ligase